MRFPVFSALLFLYSIATVAQAPPPSSGSAPSPLLPQSTGNYSMTPMLSQLDQLQTVSSALDGALARLKIDKWKADTNSKRQAQSNAESIQRNLKTALPAIISSVRSAPQDVGAEFKLYRNLNALYDVVASVAESTGAFGPKSDYEALAQQLDSLDGIRRSLGDSLEQLTASTQSQLDQLRTQVKTLQAQANPAPPPKKVVVEDNGNSSATTSTSKKKGKKPAPKSTGTAAGNTAPSSPQ